jgi:hypothetical protein
MPVSCGRERLPRSQVEELHKEFGMTARPLDIVRGCLEAYARKDRAAIEALIAPGYRFTSPLDNAIDRATYFERCWPNGAFLKAFDFICGAENGDRAFVVYEACTDAGKRFRNCEVHTVRNGKLESTEVYFGWNLPHPAREGSFIDEKR